MHRKRKCWRLQLLAAGCCAFLMLVCSCAVKKPPATPQVVKDSLPPATAIPPGWSNKDANSNPVQDGWLKTFSDPQLQALVDEAIRNNLNLKAAATRIAVAENIVIQARSQRMPVIGVTGSATYLGRYFQTSIAGKSKGRFNASSLLVGISWETDLWGRIRAQTAAARQQVAATNDDVIYAQESLAAVTAKLWYLAAYTKLLQQYADQNVQLKTEALELDEAKRQVGAIQDQQVAIAQAELATAKSQAVQVASSLQEIVRALEVLLGRYPSAELKAAAALPSLPAPVPAGLPLQLLERRPDIQAAERNVDAAFHLIQSAQAARLPSLNLTNGAGYMTNEIFDTLRFRPWVWTVGANLVAPLYTGGYLKSQVNVANENQKAALALYGQTILQAFDEVEVALADEGYLREQQQETSNALDNISRALALEKTKHEVGQVDMDPVLQLEATELGAEAAAAEIDYDLIINRINFHLALGGGF